MRGALERQGLAFKPDVVVVGWCDNDFGLPFFLIEKENYLKRDVSFLHLLLFERAKYAQRALGAHFSDQRHAHLNQVAEELVGGGDADRVRSALERLNVLGVQHGFSVLLFGSMRKEARDLCDRVGLPYYNLKERIPRDRYPAEWAVYFVHPHAEGHRVLAGHLEEELVRLGWL